MDGGKYGREEREGREGRGKEKEEPYRQFIPTSSPDDG